MIYTETNNLGEISINKAVLNDLILSAVKPWVYTGKIKVLPNKVLSTSEDGIYLCVHFSVAFGESIKEIFANVASYLAHEITSSLELELDDVVIVIDSMFTPKGNIAKRNIKYSYKNGRESI